MKISEDIELQLLNMSHKDELFRLVDSNRRYLREWLPWLDVNTSSDDTESFIRSTMEQFESGKGPQYAVFFGATLCGVCGFLPFGIGNNFGGIGYWLSETHTGRGIMTKSVQRVIDVGFREFKLNRIEICCATGNLRSRAIPERLGFKLEGILRGRGNLYGKFVDHAIYSLLASEYGIKGSGSLIPYTDGLRKI